jgi:hypothetical protein
MQMSWLGSRVASSRTGFRFEDWAQVTEQVDKIIRFLKTAHIQAYKVSDLGEPLWLSSKVVKNEKINEIERTRVCSPPRATSLRKK